MMSLHVKPMTSQGGSDIWLPCPLNQIVAQSSKIICKIEHKISFLFSRVGPKGSMFSRMRENHVGLQTNIRRFRSVWI